MPTALFGRFYFRPLTSIVDMTELTDVQPSPDLSFWLLAK